MELERLERLRKIYNRAGLLVLVVLMVVLVLTVSGIRSIFTPFVLLGLFLLFSFGRKWLDKRIQALKTTEKRRDTLRAKAPSPHGDAQSTLPQDPTPPKT